MPRLIEKPIQASVITRRVHAYIALAILEEEAIRLQGDRAPNTRLRQHSASQNPGVPDQLGSSYTSR